MKGTGCQPQISQPPTLNSKLSPFLLSSLMQKIKACLFIFLLTSLAVSAQSDITMPKASELKSYLFKRVEQIQATIYKASLEGKITIYKTDSLITPFALKEFSERGNSMNFEGNKAMKFTSKDLKGMLFIASVNSTIGSVNDQRILVGVSLLFQPSIGGALLPVQPIGNYKIDDLKRLLNEQDMQLLIYMYSYAAYSNAYFGFNSPDQDPLYYLNTQKRTYIAIDSQAVHYTANMLAAINDYIYNVNELSKSQPSEYMILDEQSKRQIAFSDVGNLYKQSLIAFISTDENDPTKGYDTTWKQNSDIIKIGTPIIDTATGKIISFRTSVETDNLKLAYFTLPVSTLKKYAPLAAIIWFHEDYFRWKPNPKTAKMNKR